MSRALAAVGAVLATAGAIGTVPAGWLWVMGVVAATSVLLRWTRRHAWSLAALLAWGAFGVLAGPAFPAVTALGLLLWAVGCVDVGAPRGLPMASWMTAVGLAALVVACLVWVPLRDGLVQSGSPLPLVLGLAALGVAAAAVALAPSHDS